MFVNTSDFLHTDVGDALRDLDFRRAARGLSLVQLREAVTEQLQRLGVEVTVVDVTQPDPSALPDNDYRIDWQSKAGGPNEHQHFGLNIPEEGWYVERWNPAGIKAKTSWKCSALGAMDLIRATIRRGEIARVQAPADTPESELAAMYRLGRVEPL
jgi:hypothetical protein